MSTFLWIERAEYPHQVLRPAIEIDATREGSRRATTCERGQGARPATLPSESVTGVPRKSLRLGFPRRSMLYGALQERHHRGRHRDRRLRRLLPC